jgi:hypothetical protein
VFGFLKKFRISSGSIAITLCLAILPSHPPGRTLF